MTDPGRTIFHARLDADATLEQWAAVAGCSRSYLARVERGERPLTRRLLAHLPLSDGCRTVLRAMLEEEGR